MGGAFALTWVRVALSAYIPQWLLDGGGDDGGAFVCSCFSVPPVRVSSSAHTPLWFA